MHKEPSEVPILPLLRPNTLYLIKTKYKKKKKMLLAVLLDTKLSKEYLHQPRPPELESVWPGILLIFFFFTGLPDHFDA